MKRFTLVLIGLLATIQTAQAQTVQEDLIGLGMKPEQADYLAGILPAGSVLGNNTFLKGRNQANSADISVLKVDSTDDTVLNADSGDVIKFAIASTPVAEINAGDLLWLGGETVASDLSTFASSATSVAYFATDTTGNRILHIANQANATAAELDFLKTRSTSTDADTIVASGDDLGYINFVGADGATYIRAASIFAEVDGSPGVNDMPGRLVFNTTSDGGSDFSERWRLDSQGDLESEATNGGNIIFNTPGKYVQQVAYVPTMAATPALGTNQILPGLSIIPTAAAGTAAWLGASTPVAGQQFSIYNNSGAVVRVKGAGAATINGGAAGTWIGMAAASYMECKTLTTGVQVCPFYSVNGAVAAAPTPAGP